MGVPVVTLAGNTPASRVGISLLSNVGLPELIAKNQNEYVKIAVDLATDMGRLQSLRERLRDMMQQSPLKFSYLKSAPLKSNTTPPSLRRLRFGCDQESYHL